MSRERLGDGLDDGAGLDGPEGSSSNLSSSASSSSSLRDELDFPGGRDDRVFTRDTWVGPSDLGAPRTLTAHSTALDPAPPKTAPPKSAAPPSAAPPLLAPSDAEPTPASTSANLLSSLSNLILGSAGPPPPAPTETPASPNAPNDVTADIQAALLKGSAQVDLAMRTLTMLPPEIGLLVALERLNVSSNLLTDLPTELGGLSRLRYINLRSNALKEFPKPLLALPGLEVVDLSRNKIKAWPVDPGNLLTIRVLSIARNRFESLPKYLPQMTDLHVLKLEHNPIRWPPGDIVKAPKSLSPEAWLDKVKAFVRDNDVPLVPPIPAAYQEGGSGTSPVRSALSRSSAASPRPAFSSSPLSPSTQTSSPSQNPLSALGPPHISRTGSRGSSGGPAVSSSGTPAHDCVSLCELYFRRANQGPAPAPSSSLVNLAPHIPISINTLSSLVFSLTQSYRFIKEASKSSVSLYKSLRPTLEAVNSKLCTFIQSLPTKPALDAAGSIPPVPALPVQYRDREADSAGPGPKGDTPKTDPSATLGVKLDLLPPIIHDTRKLLLTLHHNAEKHLMMNDLRYLRTFLSTWFGVLIEVAVAVEALCGPSSGTGQGPDDSHSSSLGHGRTESTISGVSSWSASIRERDPVGGLTGHSLTLVQVALGSLKSLSSTMGRAHSDTRHDLDAHLAKAAASTASLAPSAHDPDAPVLGLSGAARSDWVTDMLALCATLKRVLESWDSVIGAPGEHGRESGVVLGLDDVKGLLKVLVDAIRQATGR